MQNTAQVAVMARTMISKTNGWMFAGLLSGLVLLSPAVKAEEVIKSHGVSSFGELKYPADFKHWDYVNPNAPKGGEFSTWAFGTFDSMTPFILKGNAAALASTLYDTLLTGNLDEPDAMYGLVASSLEYPPSREWVIFHLRPEAKFSDGSQVTAHDVAFSFETLRDQGRPTYAVLFKDIKTAEVIDDYTVKFTFDPNGPLRELLMTVGGLPILSKEYYKTRDFTQSTLEPPLGSGEYKLLSIDAGKTVTYQRRDDYWAKDLPVNVGTNNFDILKVEYFADYTTAFEAFKSGAYSFREEFMSKIWATDYNFPALEKGWVKREQLPDGRPSGTQGFWFNLRRDKFTDPRVREAIGMAFNFEWSNASLFYGLYQRTDSFWENSGTLQADGMPSEAELALLTPHKADLPDAVFTDPAYVPPVSDAETVGDRKTLRKAAKLLEEAGWIVGDDGKRRNANGYVFTVEILNDSPGFDRIILPYIENLNRLGLDAKMTRVDAAEAEERQKKFDYDIVTQRYSMSDTPGDELRGIFGSDTANVEGSNNLTGLQNPAIDALIRKIADAKSRDEMTIAVHALDRSLRAMHIWVPQWANPMHNIAYLDVFDRPYTDTPPRSSIGEMSIWWYNPEKAQALKDAGALR